jgi:hypothetical protein
MTTLTSPFEDDLREALLDDAERQLIGEQANLAQQFVQQAHDTLREYGQEFDMNIEPVIDSLEVGDVSRDSNGVSVRLEWTHEAAGYFEVGTSRHTVQGQPVLSFIWEDPPQWVREAFDQEAGGWRVFFAEVEVSGIPAARYIRDTLEWLRQEVRE